MVLLAGCGSYSSTDSLPGPPLLAGQDCLVIVLDALGADHLGCYGEVRETSPALDALANEGVRFSRAWSQTSWTLPSTASLMTGQYQETHGVRLNDQFLGESAQTMAEAFSEAGYTCLGFTQNPFASPVFGFGQGFDRFDEMYRDEEGTSEGTMEKAVASAMEQTEGEAPRFVYAHFRRPHAPYDPPPHVAAAFVDGDYDGAVTGAAEDIQRFNAGGTVVLPRDVAHLRNLYQAGLATVDAEVGRLLDALDLSRTLVVVLSDHGDAFGQHGIFGHNFSSFEEMVHIPMMLRHPSLPAGRVVNTPVMSIDILPTLADLFGLDVSTKDVQGQSLLGEVVGEAPLERAAIFTSSRDRGAKGHGKMFAATDGRWKYLRIPDLKIESLYDLEEDPGETVDLQRDRPDLLRDFRSLWEAWEAGQQAEASSSTLQVPEEELNVLREMGYMGGARRR